MSPRKVAPTFPEKHNVGVMPVKLVKCILNSAYSLLKHGTLLQSRSRFHYPFKNPDNIHTVILWKFVINKDSGLWKIIVNPVNINIHIVWGTYNLFASLPPATHVKTWLQLFFVRDLNARPTSKTSSIKEMSYSISPSKSKCRGRWWRIQIISTTDTVPTSWPPSTWFGSTLRRQPRHHLDVDGWMI